MKKLDLKDKLNPKHTALLVIDIQKDFCSSDGVLGNKGRDFRLIKQMMERLPLVIESAEKYNILTLYTQQVYNPEKLNALQKEQYELDGKLITCDIKTNGYEFYEINPPKQDTYIKYNFNAFSNPNFQTRLKQSNIRTLIVTGVDTQFCVETAVRNGYDLGYKIVLVEDCIATNNKHIDMHNRTIDLVRNSYGVVIKSSELIKLWGGSTE